MKTWEEAAYAAAERVQRLPDWTGDVLDAIEDDLDALHGGATPTQFFWSYMAGEALLGAFCSEWPEDQRPKSIRSVDLERNLVDVVRTIITKQHDYGHENILWGGVEGVVLRAHDKVARIRNLRNKLTGPNNESLADSWLDICGYAIIGLMLDAGTFELPLAADLLDVSLVRTVESIRDGEAIEAWAMTPDEYFGGSVEPDPIRPPLPQWDRDGQRVNSDHPPLTSTYDPNAGSFIEAMTQYDYNRAMAQVLETIEHATDEELGFAVFEGPYFSEAEQREIAGIANDCINAWLDGTLGKRS